MAARQLSLPPAYSSSIAPKLRSHVAHAISHSWTPLPDCAMKSPRRTNYGLLDPQHLASITRLEHRVTPCSGGRLATPWSGPICSCTKLHHAVRTLTPSRSLSAVSSTACAALAASIAAAFSAAARFRSDGAGTGSVRPVAATASMRCLICRSQATTPVGSERFVGCRPDLMPKWHQQLGGLRVPLRLLSKLCFASETGSMLLTSDALTRQ